MAQNYSNYIKNAALDEKRYQALYQESVSNPEHFWDKLAKEFITVTKPWQHVKNSQLAEGKIEWFSGAQLNVCYNCVDRHLTENTNKIAIIWEGDNPNESKTFTYQDLYHHVCRFANLLKKTGVKKGDRVCIYLPMIPEAAFAMLACARIGAIHSVVFAGFSAAALQERINDAACKVVITADEGLRGSKYIPLKHNVDQALLHCPTIKQSIVVKRTHARVDWNDVIDINYNEVIKTVADDCPCEIMDAEDPLFILYTSGSTGKPKGVVHTQAGYLLYTAVTHKYTFNVQPDDIYWCTADIGWVTGHSYIVYGPLANAATTLMFEGIPTYPDASRFWQIIDKHRVTIFYTAPTAIRSLMALGNDYITKTNRSSLKILGTVGEPINPEAWIWYYDIVGQSRCPIMDTWWQTETGGFMITPLPNTLPLKPGSSCRPFFGIKPGIVDKQGKLVEGETEGTLVITDSWPGMMRTLYNNHARFLDTYFKPFPGYYFTGDGAKRDKDGYYWIIGRIDDILIVSGHNLGTAEVESAIGIHPDVAESAVVAVPDDIKGHAIYAFVTLNAGITGTDALKAAINKTLREEIGPIAKLDVIQWASSLPKTRSGKIMRRILRKIASGERENLGDTSTLADPSVIEKLIKQ